VSLAERAHAWSLGGCSRSALRRRAEGCYLLHGAPFQAVSWSWLSPNPCTHPGNSGLALIRQRVPLGVPLGTRSSLDKMHEFLGCYSASGHRVLQPSPGPSCCRLVPVSPERRLDALLLDALMTKPRPSHSQSSCTPTSCQV